jgi:glutaredoxin
MPMASPSLRDVRLFRMDFPDHPCPWGLKAIRLLQEQHIPFEDHRLLSQAEVDAFKVEHGVATTPQLFAGAERIGGYTDLAARLGVRAESAEVSYTPVLAVFATAALMTLVLAGGLSDFMGIALCLLAMLKLMDVPAFAASFRKYDLLSQRWHAWAGLYPGIELLVGLGILLRPELPIAALLIGATALLLGLMGMVSVGKAVFVDKLALNCACVGGNAKVPLGVVSFAENLLMALMGAVMLVAG